MPKSRSKYLMQFLQRKAEQVATPIRRHPPKQGHTDPREAAMRRPLPAELPVDLEEALDKCSHKESMDEE